MAIRRFRTVFFLSSKALRNTQRRGCHLQPLHWTQCFRQTQTLIWNLECHPCWRCVKEVHTQCVGPHSYVIPPVAWMISITSNLLLGLLGTGLWLCSLSCWALPLDSSHAFAHDGSCLLADFLHHEIITEEGSHALPHTPSFFISTGQSLFIPPLSSDFLPISHLCSPFLLYCLSFTQGLRSTQDMWTSYLSVILDLKMA